MKTLLFSLLCLLVVGVGFADINSLPSRQGSRIETVTGDYANSEVDTVKFVVTDTDLTGLAFATEHADSVSITSVSYRRVIDGEAMDAVAADTLAAFASYTNYLPVGGPHGKVETVVLAPLAEAYWFIVTYAASNNGVNPSATPVVKYKVIKQLAGK